MVKTSLLGVIVFLLAAGLTGILWWHPVVRFLNPNPGIAAFPVAAFLGLIIGKISLFSGCRTSNARSEREIPWGEGTAIPSQGYFSHKKKGVDPVPFTQ